MSRWTSLAAVVATLALACGSSSSDAGPSIQAACDDYFDALEGISCGGTTPPADEIARVRALFQTMCQDALSLPGTGFDAARVEACTSAIVATGCVTSGVPECNPQGTLPDGAPCNDAFQCESGICTVAPPGADAGTSAPGCGTCTPGVEVGQPCATGDTCTYGAICATSGAGFACATIAYGDAGAACDGLANECNTGLYCDVPSSQCAAPGGVGDPCAGSQACTPPLTCGADASGGGNTCHEPGAEGDPCQTDADCGADLGCSLATSTCAPVTWVSSGDPCGDLQRCTVGICPLTHGPGGPGPASGKCPAVIPDGQACTVGDATHTCDTFSVCAAGVCVQPYGAVCR